MDPFTNSVTLTFRRFTSWAGLRTLTPDRCRREFSNTDKDFGWLDKAAGIQTAPAIGRMAADILIAGAPVNAQLDPQIRILRVSACLTGRKP